MSSRAMTPRELNTWLLYTALGNGDVPAAVKAIENGADPDADFAGETALHWAVENNHPSLVRVLLDHGCNPSPRTRFYQHTPLHSAADHGRTSIAEMLIDGGADLESRTNGGWTPLHCAVAANAREVVALLLERGANIHARNNSGESVLHIVEHTDPVLYHFVLEKTEDREPRDEHGATPITYAAAHGRMDIVRLLLEYGASTQVTTNYGDSPADMARREGHEAIADLLDHPPSIFADDESRELRDELLEGAANLLLPYMEFGQNRPVDSEMDRQAVSRAIDVLVRVTEMDPGHWGAFCFLGLAYRVLGDRESEYDALERAYAMGRYYPDVGREFGAACMALGKGEEAVQITRDLLSLQPQDAGLIANHGLALLIAGQVEAAESAVARSLELDPTDDVTLRLGALVTAVRDGRFPRPTRWPLSPS